MSESTEARLVREVQQAIAVEDDQRRAYNWRKRRTATIRRAGDKLAKLRRSIRLQRKSRRRTMELHGETVRARRRLTLFRRRNVTPQTRALRWARSKVAITESPPGSNRGPQISTWQNGFAPWLAGLAWCGVFVGSALRAGGVKGLNYRVASVAMIEDDARAGRNGFLSWHGPRGGRRGDAVVIGGRGVHVEIIRRKLALWYLTFGGNTSPGTAGSQSDGGGVFGRVRLFSSVHGCARPAYPKT